MFSYFKQPPGIKDSSTHRRMRCHKFRSNRIEKQMRIYHVKNSFDQKSVVTTVNLGDDH